MQARRARGPQRERQGRTGTVPQVAALRPLSLSCCLTFCWPLFCPGCSPPPRPGYPPRRLSPSLPTSPGHRHGQVPRGSAHQQRRVGGGLHEGRAAVRGPGAPTRLLPGAALQRVHLGRGRHEELSGGRCGAGRSGVRATPRSSSRAGQGTPHEAPDPGSASGAPSPGVKAEPVATGTALGVTVCCPPRARCGRWGGAGAEGSRPSSCPRTGTTAPAPAPAFSSPRTSASTGPGSGSTWTSLRPCTP